MKSQQQPQQGQEQQRPRTRRPAAAGAGAGATSPVASARARRGSAPGRGLEHLESRRLLANILVNTAVDESVANATVSLREAIAQADAGAGDDTISFSAAAFPAGSLTTITLTAGALAFNGTNGTLEINGPGQEQLAISGNDASRVFNVAAGANLTLDGLTLTNGRHASMGGAIHNAGTLAISNVLVTNSNVVGANGTSGAGATPGGSAGTVWGGAIYSSGALTLTNATVNNNAATAGNGGGAASAAGGAGGDALGGGIYADGAITLTDTNVSANFASGGAGGNASAGAGGNGGDAFGGGLYVAPGAALTTDNASFSGNGASGGNGGNAGPAAIGGTGGDGNGGALYSDAAAATLNDTDFAANLVVGGQGGTGLTHGGAGDGRGGAIYNEGLTGLVGGLLNSNSALGAAATGSATSGEGGGGGIYNLGDLNLFTVEFISNGAFGGSAVSGEAAGGFGGAIDNEGNLVVADSSFTFSTASGGGSASAKAGDAGGGAIYSGGSLNVSSTTFDSNSATGGAGGTAASAIFGAAAIGGAIDIADGVASITTSTLSNNTATGGSGGNNTAGKGGRGGNGYGGGIANDDQLTLTNSTVYGNTARGGPGGAGSTTSGDGGDGIGGGIETEGVSFAAINATIASNTAAGATAAPGGAAGRGFGGGIDAFINFSLTNTIVADNTAAFRGPDIDTGGLVTLVSSIIGSTPESGYNINTGASSNYLTDVDPILGPLANNGGPTQTALPQLGSPAIDAGNDAAAEAEFGSDGTDQRGEGFDRFIGAHVDIGAVEIGGAEISVTGANGNDIDNDDDTPSSLDGTDFGAVKVGTTPPTRTFTVTNSGGGTLTLGDIDVPSGYELVEGLDASLAPGESDTFTVSLEAINAGFYGGQIAISSNAGADASYTFAVTGTVNANGFLKVNFQTASAEVPSGYVADAGLVFGNRNNGYSYGWNQNAQIGARDRNVLDDQRADTLLHMQAYGNRTWEVAMPNGTYKVRVVAGDPSYFNSVYKINVEGVLTVNGTPTSGNRFVEGTQTVTVKDGKLTISNASGAVNNKIAYLEIEPASPPPPPSKIKVNFQPGGAAVPASYVADTGAIFGSRGGGLSYGWNQSASGFARDRDVNPSQQWDTLVHTQAYGNRTWELAVPNGTYSVYVVAGDPQYFDSVYKFNVEGQLTVNGTPSSGNRFISGTKTVTVSDGRLTISNAVGAVNNKLAFIEVTPV